MLNKNNKKFTDFIFQYKNHELLDFQKKIILEIFSVFCICKKNHQIHDFMIFQRLFILFFLLSAFISNAQIVDSKKNIVSKYVNNMLNDTNDLSAPKFMTYPTLAYSPETRWEFGLSSLYIYLANRDLNNRLSEVKAFTFYTLENQYGLWLDHALYTDKNTWFFFWEIKISKLSIIVLWNWFRK